MKTKHVIRSDAEQLATERILLSTIVDSTDDAIVSVDVRGRVTSWNKGAERLYGIDAATATFAQFDDLLPSSAADLAKVFGAAGESTAHREVTRTLRNGTDVVLDETISVLRTDTGETVGAASIARDVTAKREVETALAITRRELEVRNRRLERSNADLEQFAYVASHDLSEPLRAVSGMVGLLARRYKGQLDGEADEFIAFAVDGCVRMRAMIDDLLSYSRAGSEGLKLSDVDLNVTMARVSESLRADMTATNATLNVGALPVVRADAIKIAQVLQNLVSNSLKFRRPDRPVTIDINAYDESGLWRIVVSDNGIGVEQPFRDKVFRMFKRLNDRESYTGNGIGLAIAERVVIAHGGTIGLGDGVDGGISVWFTLPHSDEASWS
ncbi:MAG: ATP-binding protein [Acidimicrobiales bacterium]